MINFNEKTECLRCSNDLEVNLEFEPGDTKIFSKIHEVEIECDHCEAINYINVNIYIENKIVYSEITDATIGGKQ